MNISNFIDEIRRAFKGVKAEQTVAANLKPACEAISEGFSSEELAQFYALSTEEHFKHGQDIVHEQDAPDTFHIILEGEAEVYVSRTNDLNESQEHILATLKKNDVIGDMALVENKPRSASVRAKTDLTVLTFKMLDLKLKPQILLILTRNMAKILSERLRFTNQVTVKKMEESLEQAEARNVLGMFMVALFWLSSLYTMSLTALIAIGKQVSNNTYISVVLISIYAICIVSTMRLSGLPLARFGITFADWPQKTLAALLYTAPVMLLAVFFKIYFVYFTPNPAHIGLFSGFDEATINGVFDLKFYCALLLVYSLFSPIQELIVRCAMQSTFFLFLPGREAFRKWNAIILANLLFSSAHSHLSFTFSILTFIPGLFWGWLFHKQRSFIAVSLSHIILGLWIVFILGFKGFVYA